MTARPGCAVCGKPTLWAAVDGGPCMECVRARHAAAVSGKCKCKGKAKPRECASGSRRWITCDRCLGTVRTLS